MQNKSYRSFGIENKLYHLFLTLEQDEILAPIVFEMFQELPAIFTSSSKNMVDISAGEVTDETINKAVSVAIDLQSIKAWILKKRYARRFMAVLLVESGKEFSESDVEAKETFFAKSKDENISAYADDVISFFLSSSTIFGKNILKSSPETEESPTTPKTQ